MASCNKSVIIIWYFCHEKIIKLAYFQLDLLLKDENGTLVNDTTDAGQISTYIKNGEWELLGKSKGKLHNFLKK